MHYIRCMAISEEEMNFLILGPNQKSKYNWMHQLFREEVAFQFPVLFYGKHYPLYPRLGFSVPKLVQRFGEFDAVWIEGPKHAKEFTGMGEVDTKVKMAIIVDYCRPYTKMFNEFIKDKCLNQIFFPTTRAMSEFLKSKRRGLVPGNIESSMLPFSVDTEVYKSSGSEKEFDAMAVFSETAWCYKSRRAIKEMLRKSKWNALVGGASKADRIQHGDYVEAINKSKIFVIANNIYKTLSMKYTEAMACGTFVLADRPDDLEYQGFEDGKHLVLYNGMDDLIEKIAHYLEHESEREKIAQQGMEMVRNRHSCEVRVKEMVEILHENFAVR